MLAHTARTAALPRCRPACFLTPPAVRLFFTPSPIRSAELLFGVILATIISNWVAHHLHPDGIYEAELDGSGQHCYYLRQVRLPWLPLPTLLPVHCVYIAGIA